MLPCSAHAPIRISPLFAATTGLMRTRSRRRSGSGDTIVNVVLASAVRVLDHSRRLRAVGDRAEATAVGVEDDVLPATLFDVDAPDAPQPVSARAPTRYGCTTDAVARAAAEEHDVLG